MRCVELLLSRRERASCANKTLHPRLAKVQIRRRQVGRVTMSNAMLPTFKSFALS
jgi:hypothetical protein